MRLKLPFLNHLKAFIIPIICFLAFYNVEAQITENFDDISQLAGNGWVMANNSNPVGSSAWFQGKSISNGGPFDAQSGSDNSYIAADCNNTSSNTVGTISNWMLSPNRTFRNGDVITFYTRKKSPDTYADRLEIRLSTNGASTNKGTTANSVGDFSTLLLSINPALAIGIYPTVWTQYTITISGLSAPTSGRIGFRYFVTSAGMVGTNSDYIGIDEFQYTPYTCPTFTLSPAAGALTGGRAGSAYSLSLTQTGALGTASFAIIAGALPPGMILSSNGTISGTPTATGTFNFRVMASDNSGCAGDNLYSITVVCPLNPVSLSFPDALCSNDQPVTLSQGSPAGGTYSGTGVINYSVFDPAAGTQEIYYDYTDPYGCAYSKNATLVVNTPPTVSFNTINPVCKNDAGITLSSGSPAGGTYSGTNVSGGTFDPSAGTQTITYSYTDANGCSDSDNTTITVNEPPVVTAVTPADVCKDADPVTLSFASPAGGTYSGTNVADGEFKPAIAGPNAVTYSYTDANGCIGTATSDITVNDLPSIIVSTPADVCLDTPPVVLSFATPSGGTYSGNNVANGEFYTVFAGSSNISYNYTDANGCTNTANFNITVNELPAITTTNLSDVCKDAAPVILSFASPAGGTYSGTNVADNKFTPSIVGGTALTYTYTDANGCTNSETKGINVNICTSVSDPTVVNNIQYYPNPTDGLFTVEFVQHSTSDVIIRISDTQGNKVISDNQNAFSGSYSKTFDLSGLAKGIYFLQLNTGANTTFHKIVVR